MIKSIAKLIVVFACMAISACSTDWTDERRAEFKTKCMQTDTFKNKVFIFSGFDDSEFKYVTVQDYVDSILIDSFQVLVDAAYDRIRKHRGATFRGNMNIKHKYRFVVPGHKPYELANMKMVMWSQYTNREGWGCVMGDFTINGKPFANVGNPTFEK